MLQWLRENLKSFAWTLWLVIAAFVIFYIPDFLRPQDAPGQAAATVGDDEVSFDDFRRAYQQTQETYRRLYGERFTPELAQQMRLPVGVLDDLVGQKVLAREARRLGLSVGDKELQKAILDLGFADESGRFIGAERYAQIVRRRLDYPSPAVFEAKLREDLLVQKLKALLAATVFVPASEVEASYRDEAERVSIRYLELPAARLAAEVTVGPEEVARHFEARREEYRRPEQRVVSHLLVDANRLRGGIEVLEADARAYYDQHAEEFTRQEEVRARHILLNVNDQRSEAEARSRLEEARRRIEAGEDFAALAREMSEDTGSKDRGGDLGSFGRGHMVPEFEEAAFEAAKSLRAGAPEASPSGRPTKVVGPIKTGFGLHLVEVLGYQAGGLQPFEQVQPQIRLRLQGERAQGLAGERARELAARIEEEKIAGKEQLQALTVGTNDLAFDTTAPFGKQDPVPGVGRVPEFAEAAFSLAPGKVSAPVKVPRGWAILRLDEVKEPRVPELAEVEPQVRRALIQTRQQEQAMARLAAARRDVEAGGKTLAQAATELGVEVKESGDFGRSQAISGLGVNPALAAAALALGAGQLGGPVAHRQSAVLFEVVDRKHWDPAAFARDRETTRRRLEAEAADRMLAALIESRKSELGVSYDRQLLESLGVLESAPETT
jgi:peptidyl-prolyl cis-trans isomerase D